MNESHRPRVKSICPSVWEKIFSANSPQAGYTQLHGGIPGPDGFYYDCAASAVWCEEQKLNLKVQIIDTYLGNFLATFSFREDEAIVSCFKTAEGFLAEYSGMLLAHSHNACAE